MTRVTGLFTYPIKSCKGTALDQMTFGATGPLWDRHFILIDEDGTFITQREEPKLCMVEPKIAEGKLDVVAPSGTASFEMKEGIGKA